MAEFDGEWIALEMVDLIIDKTSSKLYDNYITSREIPFAAGSVLKDVYDVVRTAFLKRDSGSFFLQFLKNNDYLNVSLKRW